MNGSIRADDGENGMVRGIPLYAAIYQAQSPLNTRIGHENVKIACFYFIISAIFFYCDASGKKKFPTAGTGARTTGPPDRGPERCRNERDGGYQGDRSLFSTTVFCPALRTVPCNPSPLNRLLRMMLLLDDPTSAIQYADATDPSS